jgi:hypoxanthine phosphoribosyltransferase
MSHYLGVPMHPLEVCLRDSGITVSDTALAEDAAEGMNILVVDDINDSGATMEWICQDWQSVTGEEQWQSICHNNVKFATLLDNVNSNFTVDYSANNIDKVQDPVWVVFPWEDWWTK